MNIFYLHADPYKAATYFYDKHKVKMILESAQMLCTAHHVYGNGDNVSKSNYYWLYEHMLGIGKVYTKRYGKYHLSIEKCRDALAFAPVGIPDIDFTEPPQCMPDQYKVSGCSITAYWNYYEGEKYLVANKNEQLITRPYEIFNNIIGDSNNIPC